jgi:hypothetical protein
MRSATTLRAVPFDVAGRIGGAHREHVGALAEALEVTGDEHGVKSPLEPTLERDEVLRCGECERRRGWPTRHNQRWRHVTGLDEGI